MLKAIIFTASILFMSQSFAGIKEAKTAINDLDYSKAIQELNPLVMNGDIEATILMGNIYLNNDAFPSYPDTRSTAHELAFAYFASIADKGNDEADFLYGKILFSRFLPDRKKASDDSYDYKKAFHYLKPAADKRNTEAQTLIGKMYLYGDGMDANIPEGIRYLKMAADKNDIDALYLLAENSDDSQTFKYYSLVASHADFDEERPFLKDTTDGMFPNLLYKRLGDLYYYGIRGAPQDYKKSLEYYFKIYNLYLFHIANPEQNLHGSKSIYSSSSSIVASIGQQYYFGQGVPQDYKEALYYFNIFLKAHETPHTKYDQSSYFYPFEMDTFVELGNMYYYGLGVKKDYRQAAKFFKISAVQQNIASHRTLANLYYYGKGVKRNLILAYALSNTKDVSSKKDVNPQFLIDENNKIPRINKEDIAKLMTTEQIDIANHLTSLIDTDVIYNINIQKNQLIQILNEYDETSRNIIW